MIGRPRKKKLCTVCLEVLYLNAFARTSDTADGRKETCNDCLDAPRDTPAVPKGQRKHRATIGVITCAFCGSKGCRKPEHQAGRTP